MFQFSAASTSASERGGGRSQLELGVRMNFSLKTSPFKLLSLSLCFVFVFVRDVQLVERTAGCIACATNQLYAISFNLVAAAVLQH